MKYEGLNIMKKRFLAALLCLCLLVGLVPGMGTTAFAAGSYNIGDTVTFAGYDWYIIGTESDGVKAPSGYYTLFAKNDDFGDAAFRAGANQEDSTANHYKDSDLQKKMEEIANGFSAGDKANIAARDTLDGIAGESPTGQLLWPVSEAEWYSIDQSLRAFPDHNWTRAFTEGNLPVSFEPDGEVVEHYAYHGRYANENGRWLGSGAGVLEPVGNPVDQTYAVRPALYVKAEALPEKVEGIQVAFGGQWWYVVGQGEKGSVPGPENTVTLFENPREAMGAQVILAKTNSSNYLGSDLQQKMADFSSNLNLAGKESSLIVPRTLTSADGISGETAHDQPFWPLSKDEADRTDAEILKSELYDDVSFVDRYWLRTTCDTTSLPTVYAVKGIDGTVVSDYSTSNYGVRPAFYLDISDAFYLAKDAKRVTIGGVPYPLVLEGFEEYKYTIFDDSLKLSVTADPAQAAQTGETLSFGYVANTGENQYLSCVLTPDGSTDVLYYNKLVELSDTAAASGTVNIPLTGVSDGNYTLRLYTEQENNRSTDFASRTVNVQITVKDGTASIRDLGNIQLVGDSGGQDGREVELRNNGTQIQWKYTDEPDTAWRDLVALDAITGGDGADGADGREVELQVANGYIQWRYTTGADTDWKNLMPLSDLKGEDGEDGREVELKNDGSSILWRYVGEGDDAWRPLVDLSDITGSDGADGKQVELRVEGGYIQWKYDADSDWQNLIALSALQGIKGDKGDKGDPGEDGDTPYIGDNGNWWIGGVDTGIKAEGSDGADGSDGSDGKDGQDGKDGEDGKDGLTPYIGSNGNWWIGTTDTGIKAAGVNGADGKDGKDGINGKDGANGKNGANGKDGADGVGIADIKLNENGELIVTLTDGTEKNLGKVKGEDGVGISGVSINENGELIVTLTDGTELNAGAVPTAAADDSNLKTLVYVSVGTAGVSLAGLIGLLAFLLTKRKSLIGK